MDSFERGDIVMVDFSPISGHEQRGRRPALILRNTAAQRLTNMVVVCPITNTNNKHPLHCPLDDRTQTTGVVLCEHVRSMDLTARNAQFVEKAPVDIVNECADTILAMIE